MPVNWTETRLKRLKLLHKEGFSATIIAGKLGPAFTKSIVLRKVHQLDEERLARAKVLAARKAAKARLLKRASKVIEAPRKAAPALRELASAVAQVKAEPIRIVAPVPPPAKPAALKGVALFDLREGHCRWPLGNDRPARLFCGAASVGTSFHGASTISASRSPVLAELRSRATPGRAGDGFAHTELGVGLLPNAKMADATVMSHTPITPEDRSECARVQLCASRCLARFR
ncbi:MAG: GcrA family cell cycle regulator, partial [Microvirga sp.]